MRDNADGVIGGEDLFGKFSRGGGEVVRMFSVDRYHKRKKSKEGKSDAEHGGTKRGAEEEANAQGMASDRAAATDEEESGPT